MGTIRITIPETLHQKMKEYNVDWNRIVCQAITRRIDRLEAMEPYLLSEKTLAKDWDTPEEDEAWKNL